MGINYLVIEGNIGAGKTSLAKKIAKDNNANLILERFANNPFLPKFYKDPERYSFPLELSFLADRYKQLKDDLGSLDLFKSFTVSDYYFMKSLIFSRATLPEDEFLLYRQLFYIIYNSLPKPDLFVYLHVGVNRLLENIKKRGRSYEKQIKPEYLEKIQEGYFDFFKQHAEHRFLIIDISRIDFIEKQHDYKLITNAIFDQNHPTGITRLIL
jgi:deoxyadenosine/deoxycytidine kinase